MAGGAFPGRGKKPSPNKSHSPMARPQTAAQITGQPRDAIGSSADASPSEVQQQTVRPTTAAGAFPAGATSYSPQEVEMPDAQVSPVFNIGAADEAGAKQSNMSRMSRSAGRMRSKPRTGASGTRGTSANAGGAEELEAGVRNLGIDPTNAAPPQPPPQPSNIPPPPPVVGAASGATASAWDLEDAVKLPMARAALRWRGGYVGERQNARSRRAGECRCQPRDGADRAGRAAVAAGRADVRTERVAEWRDKPRGPAYRTTDDCACRTAAARSARG